MTIQEAIDAIKKRGYENMLDVLLSDKGRRMTERESFDFVRMHNDHELKNAMKTIMVAKRNKKSAQN